MRESTGGFRAWYGTGLRHLVLMVACFAVTGWIVLRLVGEPRAERMLLWFVGAAVVHDLLLFPVYATADAALRRLLGVDAHPGSGARVSALNHIRLPALAGGLLFLVYLPSILGQGGSTYLAATGQHRQPYLSRWLAITAALFLVSAVWYAIRISRRPRRSP
ncbi:hypothetical protein OOK41_20740 [Micromonospora sp. NBC_01655]|uniref:hypothetical protein n=1 Tax=Micromonospora sp. NBC_01655 TaxID=2975983 RepID=UPI002252F393|nr:hypothetical protein [Micromonospora sp. NBC_01655]MCX4472705.1 hypothetical protein [Micromonospora sp. NBC_01655]